MAKSNSKPLGRDDVRWFVWTIVFLVVVGVSLVSYIVFSDNGNTVSGYIVRPRPVTMSKK